MMIKCPICNGKEQYALVLGSIPYSTMGSAGNRYDKYINRCNVCNGEGYITESVYNDIAKKLKDVKPHKDDYLIKNPKREIDLDE